MESERQNEIRLVSDAEAELPLPPHLECHTGAGESV
jgi:hypothetical protein